MRDYCRRALCGDPVKRIYEIHSPHGRQSWDHTAMLEAVRPGVYWNYHALGRVRVEDDGVTVWQEESGGKQSYLLPKADYESVRTVIDGLLSPTLPPKHLHMR